MKQQGANIVARNAVDFLIDHLEETAVELTQQAQSFTIHARRTIIAKKDIMLAIRFR